MKDSHARVSEDETRAVLDDLATMDLETVQMFDRKVAAWRAGKGPRDADGKLYPPVGDRWKAIRRAARDAGGYVTLWNGLDHPAPKARKPRKKNVGAITSPADVKTQLDIGRTVVEEDDRLTRSAKACWGFLADLAIDQTSVQVVKAQTKIADGTGMARTTVQAAMILLEDAGYVRRYRSNTHGGNFHLIGRAAMYAKRAGRGTGSKRTKRSPVSIWWLLQPWHRPA